MEGKIKILKKEHNYGIIEYEAEGMIQTYFFNLVNVDPTLVVGQKVIFDAVSDSRFQQAINVVKN